MTIQQAVGALVFCTLPCLWFMENDTNGCVRSASVCVRLCVYVCENIFQVPECQYTGKLSYTVRTLDRYKASYHTKTKHNVYIVQCTLPTQ